MRNEFEGNPWNEFATSRECLYCANAFRPGFHGDLQLIEVIENLLKNCTTFVETGSYHGCTIYYIANNFKNIQSYSCELNSQNYAIAIENTKECNNAQIFCQEKWFSS